MAHPLEVGVDDIADEGIAVALELGPGVVGRVVEQDLRPFGWPGGLGDCVDGLGHEVADQLAVLLDALEAVVAIEAGGAGVVDEHQARVVALDQVVLLDRVGQRLDDAGRGRVHAEGRRVPAAGDDRAALGCWRRAWPRCSRRWCRQRRARRSRRCACWRRRPGPSPWRWLATLLKKTSCVVLRHRSTPC